MFKILEAGSFMDLRVLGVGDNVADHYLHSNIIYPGGNAFNFAVYAKMLGATAAYMGIFGDDFPGLHVLRTAKHLGIGVSHCRLYHGENGCSKVRLVNGDRIFVSTNHGGVSRERPLTLDESDLEYIKTFQLLHTSINSYIEHDWSKYAAVNIPISFDFSDKVSDEYLAAYSPYVTYAIVSCSHLSVKETDLLIDRIHAWGCANVIATRGDEGSVFSDGKELYRHKALLVAAVDTMGAGDSFLTAFLLHLIDWKLNHPGTSGQELKKAIDTSMEEGSHFAAQTCMVEGAFGYGVVYEGYKEPKSMLSAPF
jgi:sugar/nucleoside kinase (ribokinase family)